MNEINQEQEKSVVETVETPEVQTPSRREAFKRAGLLAGGAMLGGSLLNAARAQDDGMMTGDMGNSNGGMMGGNQSGGMMNDKMMMNPKLKGMMADDNAPPPIKDKMSGKEANDIEILNYALLLEYLEADYYTRAMQAQNARAYLRGAALMTARTLVRDETTHVQVIIDAITKLGGQPRQQPQFQFPNEAFISQIAFLSLSAELEATGVGAYLNEAPALKRKDVLQFAASIYGNEARHVGLIRFLLGDLFSPDEMEHPLTREVVLQNIDPFIIR